MKNKKGVSPIIATVMLIVLVMIIAAIVFMWLRGFAKEAITKFGGENIELSCEKIVLDGTYSAGVLVVSNDGNVPINSFNVRSDYPGGHDTQENIFSDGLAPGGRDSVSFTTSPGTTKITLIPVLLGVTKNGDKKTHVCQKAGEHEIFI